MLNISLEYEKSIVDVPPCEGNFSYDEELDDIESLIMDICDCLSETERVKFNVLGFGESQWPVDVWLHLSSIVPQVPDVLMALAKSKDVTLDFYEQGVGRVLHFHCHSHIVEVTCKDLFDTFEHPSKEFIDLSELKQMLTDFLKSFIYLATIISPNIVNHEMFQKWLKDISPCLNLSSPTRLSKLKTL